MITAAIICAAAFALGWFVGWVHGDDHGRNQTNREWLAPPKPRHFVKPGDD